MQVGTTVFDTKGEHCEVVQHEELVERPTITTFTQKRVNIFDFSENDVCIEDIARSLSNTCRFRGHVHQSVNDASHSLMVRECVVHMFDSTGHTINTADNWKLLLAALLHDANEVYFCDLISSYKPWMYMNFNGVLTPIKEVEKHILRVIYRKFGIEEFLCAPWIKKADRLACSWEATTCCGRKKPSGYPPAPMFEWTNITSPEESEAVFLENFNWDMRMIESLSPSSSSLPPAA